MMGRSSMPKQMMKKGGMAKKKMNMGGMTKMPMMQEGGDVKVPTKEEFDAMTPKQQEARRRAASLNNITLSPKEKADKKAFLAKKKMGDKPKKMNMGGMATANKYDKNKKEKRREADMQSGKYGFRQDKVIPMPPEPVEPDYAEEGRGRPPGMKKGGVAKKMNMGGMAKASYSKGSKVRGYGMARGGKACKMR